MTWFVWLSLICSGIRGNDVICSPCAIAYLLRNPWWWCDWFGYRWFALEFVAMTWFVRLEFVAIMMKLFVRLSSYVPDFQVVWLHSCSISSVFDEIWSSWLSLWTWQDCLNIWQSHPGHSKHCSFQTLSALLNFSCVRTSCWQPLYLYAARTSHWSPRTGFMWNIVLHNESNRKQTLTASAHHAC